MNDVAEGLYRRAQQLAGQYREQNVTRILALLEEAADFEHVEALFELGNWRHHGIGAERDDAQAARLWARAAERGHVEACFNLAIACESGIGVARDPNRAFGLYSRCADAGHLNAHYEVGRCLHYGIGTAVDRVGAGRRFATARRFGHAEAICDDAEPDGPRRMPRPSFAGPFRPAP
jgi:TPR repeat protein